MKPELKNLNERVDKLSEVEGNRKHTAFARFWSGLSEVERQLADAVLREFGALKDAGQITTEELVRKWVDGLPVEKRVLAEKMVAWRTNSQ